MGWLHARAIAVRRRGGYGGRVDKRGLPAIPPAPAARGGVPEWLKGTDCKSVGLRLRWFKSNPLHQSFQCLRMAFLKRIANTQGIKQIHFCPRICGAAFAHRAFRLTVRLAVNDPCKGQCLTSLWIAAGDSADRHAEASWPNGRADRHHPAWAPRPPDKCNTGCLRCNERA